MPSHARDGVDLAARLAPNRAAIFVGIDVGLIRNGRTNDGFTSISAIFGGRYVRRFGAGYQMRRAINPPSIESERVTIPATSQIASN